MNEDKKELKDSGKRQEFTTGAVRDLQTGKGRFDLMGSHSEFRVARVFEKGATKYKARNWESGIPAMRFMDSAKRHISQYLAGDQSEDHIAQATWNLLCHMDTLHWIEIGELPPDLDDRPARMKVGYVPPYAKAKEDLNKVLSDAIMHSAADALEGKVQKK